MPYPLLADLTVLVHLGFVAFVAVGGFLAWRYPAILIAHAPSVLWALGIATVGWPCPLTDVEKWLRLRAGAGGYSGAFMDRYVTGLLYPEQYTDVARALVATAVLSSYAGLGLRRRPIIDKSTEVNPLAPKRRQGSPTSDVGPTPRPVPSLDPVVRRSQHAPHGRWGCSGLAGPVRRRGL